jgi:hypothetical protein
MKLKKIIAIVFVFILGILITDVYSASDSIKQRMISRLPVIVVAAENKDRKLVYEAIAKKQGTTTEVVGKHRAVQIAGKAKTGEWLQDANGKWYQKK